MVHTPGWFTVTVAGEMPEMLQIAGVVVLSVTGNPELAVALTLNGATP
jgi:hypothetical protein